MDSPLEIIFRDIAANPGIENLVHEKFSKIQKISPDVVKCRVVMDKLSKHHKKGNICRVSLDIKLARFVDIVVHEESMEGEPSLTSAIREVFKRAHELVRKQIERRETKISRRKKKEVEIMEPEERSEGDE